MHIFEFLAKISDMVPKYDDKAEYLVETFKVFRWPVDQAIELLDLDHEENKKLLNYIEEEFYADDLKAVIEKSIWELRNK